jgi:hypothetical protein
MGLSLKQVSESVGHFVIKNSQTLHQLGVKSEHFIKFAFYLCGILPTVLSSAPLLLLLFRLEAIILLSPLHVFLYLIWDKMNAGISPIEGKT